MNVGLFKRRNGFGDLRFRYTFDIIEAAEKGLEDKERGQKTDDGWVDEMIFECREGCPSGIVLRTSAKRNSTPME